MQNQSIAGPSADVRFAKRDASRAQISLDITIVGAGLGGLAAAYVLGRAGHHVTVLESAAFSGSGGAGIQVTPNMSRLLIRWGLGEKLKGLAVVPQGLSLRRYQNGERVGWNKWGDLEPVHGAPYYHVHRGDLHKLLLDLATPYMKLRLNSKVRTVEPSTPHIVLESGEIIKTDLVIGADGGRSIIRDIVTGRKDDALETGDSAYRATLSTEELLRDPELRSLVEETEASVWMGPQRHIVGYCIRAKREYNLVMIRPSRGEGEVPVPTSLEQMKTDFAGFEPRIRKLLHLVPSTLSWALVDRAPLRSWIHSNNTICLLGDACHPMLPYRAQGAAMAVEDAAVLGNLFSQLTSRKQVPFFLQTYQQLRHPRTSATQDASRMNQGIFHLVDGPEQEARDLAMRTAMEVELRELRRSAEEDAQHKQARDGDSPNAWANKAKIIALYDYDADAVVERWRQTQSMEFNMAVAKL